MRLFSLILLAATVAAHAQFEMQESHTTASLRGIHAVSASVAWASGTAGTVLHTEDGGVTWQTCAVPKGAEKLDFRGVQGFDAKSAVVLSSGKGPLSRIYKTVDGCQTWKLVFTDPDADGFFDAVRKVTSRQMYVLGDPVKGKFSMFFSPDAGDHWFIADDPGLEAEKADGAFAASNSSLIAVGATLFFGTGGGTAAHVYGTFAKCAPGAAEGASCAMAWAKSDTPLAAGAPAAGIFSIAGRTTTSMSGKSNDTLVAVGGVYDKPEEKAGTAATSNDGGKNWIAATTTPQGYRSAVAYDPLTRTWIAVGPTGTDVSHNDGRDWQAVEPVAQDKPDANKNWNALSLPFVVGPKGRIGKLRTEVLMAPSKK